MIGTSFFPFLGRILGIIMVMQVITTFGIGRVIQSKSSEYSEGDIVVNPQNPVAEYCITASRLLRKIDPASGISLPDYLSSLGWFFFFLIFFLHNRIHVL